MRLSEITIQTVAGGQQTITLQNYDKGTDVEYWRDNDKAVSGKYRHNLRGNRARYHLRYDACKQPAVFLSIINNIVADLTGGQDDITLIEDGDYRVVVPTDSFLSAIEYASQIGEYVPDMEFIDAEINSLDGTYVEAGYVTAGYVI